MTQPLHYRLTTEEWLEVSHRLTRAELIVLYYLRTLDPFGDRPLDLKVVDIAEKTNLTKGTVSKALRSLSDQELIELEMVTVRVRLNPSKLNSPKKFPVGNQVSCEKQEKFPTGNIEAPEETFLSCRKLPSSVGNFQDSELAQDRDSGSPHTIQTIHTDPNSLYEEPEPKKLEREKNELFDQEGQPIAPYRDWLLIQLSKLPERVGIPELWIDKNAPKISLQRKFLRYRESLQEDIVPPAPATENFPSSEDNDRGMALARLRAKWNLPGSRAQAIAEAEKWGFQVSDDGIADIEEG